MSNSPSCNSEPSPLVIERPPCAKCQTRTMLARITPGPSGYDLRTFECPACENVQIKLAALDSMKSGHVGWISGELKPPG